MKHLSDAHSNCKFAWVFIQPKSRNQVATLLDADYAQSAALAALPHVSPAFCHEGSRRRHACVRCIPCTTAAAHGLMSGNPVWSMRIAAVFSAKRSLIQPSDQGAAASDNGLQDDSKTGLFSTIIMYILLIKACLVTLCCLLHSLLCVLLSTY